MRGPASTPFPAGLRDSWSPGVPQAGLFSSIRPQVNGIGEPDVQALAQLRAAPRLTHLRLNLSLNGLADGDVAPLAALAEAPALRTLTVDLSCNGLRPEGCS